ncbi:inactive tyrosine-protein kinase PRAG1-like [Callorhinchus milii]|uniref:Tyrosine-protein kinase SgK223-like n=1 Tax=Callorhinchus milii TaxID=7868 RepID=A0A4W3JG19_CALMI|nr:inactive tyrosine-protein kinase PRAG1-like [Callorhinchus milii]XP_007890094.1 inactive tyrosine-protein kinase PRAG1-like [Callorhinchus milii]|eukprot:gi/632949323/ref/XP_007890093.1/ PREDICTED: tyrosine-protein kinase SgK223-like [Callorhinchus milii]
MSLCNDFSEHVWKPGSCKNCFKSRGSHKLQTATDTGKVATHTTNVFKNNGDRTLLDEEYALASSHSKPTIAVKPTLMNSDGATEMWADVNMNSEGQQVTQEMSSEKSKSCQNNNDIEPGTMQLDCNSCRCLRAAVGNHSSDDAVHSWCPKENCGEISRHGSESLYEQNVYHTESSGDGEGHGYMSTPANTDTFTITRGVDKQQQQHSLFPHQEFKSLNLPSPNNLKNSLRSRSTEAEKPMCSSYEEVLQFYSLDEETSNVMNSYMLIQSPNNSLSTEAAIPDLAFPSGSDQIYPLDKALSLNRDCSKSQMGAEHREIRKFETTTNTFFKLGSSYHGEVSIQCNEQYLQEHLDTCDSSLHHQAACPDSRDVLFMSGCGNPKELLPWEATQIRSYASQIKQHCHEASGSDCTNCSENKEEIAVPEIRPTVRNNNGNLCNWSVNSVLKPDRNEPIYAESTKRKNRAPGNKNNVRKAQWSTVETLQKETVVEHQEDGRTDVVGTDDVSSQRPTITVVTSHTDEDNRTFYLSSPDSAVAVQWQCFNPGANAHQDHGNPSPSLQHSPTGYSNQHRSSHESCSIETANLQHSSRPIPAVPPKQSKASTVLEPISTGNSKSQELNNLSMYKSCDSVGSDTASENHSVSQHCPSPTDISKESLGAEQSGKLSITIPISHPYSRVLTETAELSSSSLTAERRSRYYKTAWGKQCKIDEEEENEETRNHSQEGQPVSPMDSHCAKRGDKSLETAASTYNAPIPPITYSGVVHYGEKSQAGSYSEGNRRSDVSKATIYSSSEWTESRNPATNTVPPPPPPKKQSRERSMIKMSHSTSEGEKPSCGSVENLVGISEGMNGRFPAVSTESLGSDSDTRTFHDRGQAAEIVICVNGSHSWRDGHPVSAKSMDDALPSRGQPPPLPLKKVGNRTTSAPDCSSWRDLSPRRTNTSSSSSYLNVSVSDGVLHGHEGGSSDECHLCSPSSPSDRQHVFSSCESLEKCVPGYMHKAHSSDDNSNRNDQSLRSVSSNQISLANQSSSVSNLQLHRLLSNMDSKEGMHAKLGSLYAESLRRLAVKCEDFFMRGQKAQLHFNENNWSDFKLICNQPCCDAGDAIYYSAAFARDPDNQYAVKVCKNHGPDSHQAHFYSLSVQQSLSAHFNIQQDCGYFIASVPPSMLPRDEEATALQDGRTADGDDQGNANTSLADLSSSVTDRVVVITREVPHQTAADYAREWLHLHRSQPDDYERWVCLLLLQLCNGLEHLKERNVTHCDLCLENLLLVHCRPGKRHSENKKDRLSQVRLSRLIISNFLKAKQKPVANDARLRRDQARLAPEIVSASQYKKFDEFQTGILLYELLHQPNPFEVNPKLREQEYNLEDLPSIPRASLYSKGLQHLVQLLLEADPIKRIHISEAKRILQCLLWGPRKDLMEQKLRSKEMAYGVLQNWLDVKRALLMIKFAERSLSLEHRVELEDWLCCQYFAFASPDSLYHTARLLHLL